MSQPPIPFGSASAGACEISAISAPYLRVGPAPRIASAPFDLNGPPDLLQYRWRRINQTCHHSLQLFPALCADFKVLPRRHGAAPRPGTPVLVTSGRAKAAAFDMESNIRCSSSFLL